MSQGMTCPQCGNENSINNLFCLKCGSKLDYSSFKPGQQMAPGRRLNLPIGSMIRVLILFLLMGTLGLLLWPIDPEGAPGTHEKAVECNRKLVLLDHAFKEKRQETAVFEESEVNGFLADLVKETAGAEEETEGNLSIGQINLRFTQRYIVAVIVARIEAINFRLTYEIVLKPKPNQSIAEAEISQARFGHLKLPGGLKRWMADRTFMRVFRDRQREISVMENSAVEALAAGKIKLRVLAN